MLGAVAGGVTAAIPELPQIEGSEEFRRVEGLVYARDGRTVLRRLRAPTSRRYAQQGDIPEVLIDAVVAAEDRRFFEHSGIDPRGVLRAAVADLQARAVVQGGSTITQQLVKNAYVGSDQSIARKSREAALAMALETRWSKRRILTAYLNTAYFGRGHYGIRNAARGYFGVEPRALTTNQAAVLAGSLRAPEIARPDGEPRVVRRRRNEVLSAMLETGALEPAAARRARSAPLPSARRGQRDARAGELAPHFTDDVVAGLVRRLGANRTFGGGIRVRTTIDPRMQTAANSALQTIGGTGLSAALVAIDVRSGEVMAMTVGGQAGRNVFNVASSGRRQPGSAFKPFTLAAAYATGMSPDAELRSAPFSSTVDGTPWRVTNASGTYAGDVSIEAATWTSDNTVYARLSEQIGIEATVRMARTAGIASPVDRVPAAVLGGLRRGVTPLELAHAYATFARRGVRRGDTDLRPRDVLRVSDPRAGALPADKRSSTRALPAPVADLVTQTLTGVIERGTGTRAAIGRPAAGKTGTTENYADAWFVGYTPELVAAVWVGNASGSVPMRSEYQGGPVTGGTWPAVIWSQFMRDALDGTPERPFAANKLEYVTVLIDPGTRLLADEWCTGAVPQRFLAGTQPTERSKTCIDGERPLPAVVGMALTEALELLGAEGFETETREVATSDPAQQGIVTAQVPPAGTNVRRDRPVRLLVGTSARSLEDSR